MKKRMKVNNKGVTLILLVITVIILIILAGITLINVMGENGLVERAKQARQAKIEADMKEQLLLAVQNLQIEKLGKATLEDITQEWLEKQMSNYECIIKEDMSISGKRITIKKDGVIGKFIIDEKLTIIELEKCKTNIEFSYETLSREGEDLNIVITITNNKNGIKQIELTSGMIINGNGKKSITVDYKATLGVEYKFKIIAEDGEEKEEIIKIDDYYYKIIKNLGEGISSNNIAIKAAYNKSYDITITLENEYILDTLMVTMGGKKVAVDKTTGRINIPKVIGDIEITATSRKLEIQTTTPIVGTSASSTSSVEDSSQAKGTPLYILFEASLEGIVCEINPTVPYNITTNGIYEFKVTGEYQGKVITKQIEVKVNKYQAAQKVVKYDAGEWTKEEIQTLKDNKLYDINISHSKNTIYKLNSSDGLNFTFGGFTDKGDTTNASSISSGEIIISRNQSVSPESGRGIPNYGGWQIFESKEENGKTYVTKLVHAGSPENFVYQNNLTYGNTYRVEYLLSNGIRQTNYNRLEDGTTINPRSWDMYKDKELDEKGMIQDVHLMTYEECAKAKKEIRKIGSYYYLASAYSEFHIRYVTNNGDITSGSNRCYGIRPVVSLNKGVYIASGEGTEESPYILTKE